MTGKPPYLPELEVHGDKDNFALWDKNHKDVGAIMHQAEYSDFTNDEQFEIAHHIVKAFALYREKIKNGEPTQAGLKQTSLNGEAVLCPNGKFMFVVMMQTGTKLSTMASQEWWDDREQAVKHLRAHMSAILNKIRETTNVHSMAASTPDLLPHQMKN